MHAGPLPTWALSRTASLTFLRAQIQNQVAWRQKKEETGSRNFGIFSPFFETCKLVVRKYKLESREEVVGDSSQVTLELERNSQFLFKLKLTPLFDLDL